MSGAVNGRVRIATTRNPIAAMELQFPLPPGEQAALKERFDAQLALLDAPLDDRVLAQVVWTAYRAGWRDSWLHGLAVRKSEVHAGIDDRPEPLSAHVVAVVDARTPDAPETVGKGKA